MLMNHLIIAWRNVQKHRAHSFINIAGLSIGMAVALLIGLWIWDELSFDRYHQNYDRIAQVADGRGEELLEPIGDRFIRTHPE